MTVRLLWSVLLMKRFGNHFSGGRRAPAVPGVQALNDGIMSVRIALWTEPRFGRGFFLAFGRRRVFLSEGEAVERQFLVLL